jgi:polar amino acid transport system substrate-binding protein
MRWFALLLPLALAFGCAAPSGPAVSPAARSELAPTGKLRVGLLAANPLFVTQGTPPEALRGIAVDLGRELASRLAVPMEPVRYPNVAALVEGVGKGEWDVAFLGIDPERAAVMNFTSAYLYGENTFLVPPGSPARSMADLDRPGKTVATLARSVQENYLRQNMKNATLVSMSGPPAAFGLLKEGKVDAVASSVQVLGEGAKAVPGAKLLEGSYYDSPIGMAVARGRSAGLAYAYEFIEEQKSSGAVRESLSRSGLAGARVAPAGAK